MKLPNNFDSSWKLTTQVGAGIDINIGNRGVFIGIEMVDYISNFSSDGNLRHDAFLFGLVGLPLF
ncbi:MAG: hypothetical protein U5K69_14250 [Balneolaceae bacterium]|nr:hypothetical protein [Balneolaceae bacterium]